MSYTAQSLYQSSSKLGASRRHPANSASRTLKNVIPYVGMKSLLIQFLHDGMSVPGTRHQVDLMFSGVEFSQEPMPKDRWLEINYKGQKLWARKIDVMKNPVHVRCSCPDFYFTFAYWDFVNDALFGTKPRPYKRKTLHRKPRNPMRIPGMCKHIANSIQLMQTMGWCGVNLGR